MEPSQWIEIYGLFRNEIHKSLDFHVEHFGRFLTLISALLGITATAISYFKDNSFSQGFASCLGAVLGILASLIGMKLCDRFYEGMLEAITITAKIERALGIDVRPSPNSGNVPEMPFPKDEHLLPARWSNDRRDIKTSKEFVDARMKEGSNKWVRRTFCLFIIANAVLLIYGVGKLSAH